MRHFILTGIAATFLFFVTQVFVTQAPVQAQSARPDPPLRFEAASIKRAAGVNSAQSGCHGIDSVYTPAEKASAPPLGRCVLTERRLSHLVGIAWGITMPLLKSGPDWIQRGDERFDVQAEAEDPTKTTEKQLLQMLQTLLIERFQMKYHLEQVKMPGFGLSVAKGGSKLRESKSEETDVSFGPGGKPGQGPGMFKAHKYSMQEFIRMLSASAGRGPGADHTGLTGLYDFNLNWDDEAGPALETALREQLGLRMEPEKVETSYFVIDSASQPSPN